MTYTTAEELELGRRIQRGDVEARNLLVEANLQVVRANVRRFRGRGVDDEDLRSEGHLGLVRAAEDYDPDYGVRFSTHAHYRVRESMRMAVANQSRTIRVPHHAQRKGRDPFKVSSLDHDVSDQEYEDDDRIAQLVDAVRRLPQVRREVIERSFGLHHGGPETLDAIARRMNCSRDRVRTLRTTTIERLNLDVRPLLAILAG